jgi:hypothetical protein
MALSEDILAVCGTTLQLRWANLLRRMGMFERWKKKSEMIRELVTRQKKELERLYKGGVRGSPV